MYKFITNLSKDEYETFSKSSPYTHFMQSYDFGKIKEFKNFIPHFIGIKYDGKLVCAALLLEKKLKLGYCYLYSPRGYIIDFNNHELVKIFTQELKKFSKEKKAVFIKIDPAIKRHSIDQDGNIIEGENNYELINFLSSIGYRHLGYNLGFEHEQPRFTFRIDLEGNWDNIYSKMHPTTRKILNKGNQYNLEIYKGSVKDISDFYLTMIETSKRENIIQSPIEYYKKFYEIFNKDGSSDLYIVKANIAKVISTFEEKISNLKNEIESVGQHDSEKNKNKLNDLNNQLNKLKKELEEIKKIKEDSVVL